MKFFLVVFAALCMALPALGFTFSKSSVRSSTALNMADEARINTKIDLESEKVATMEALSSGEKKVYCRCWKSDTFPLCDGKHMDHNKACGDNVGPLIVTVAKE
mmetsp:Transcript_23804/g.35729  ORF Transcript_23804/g.35729 Transcript_23804/m.35729 type:complete len:104 (-) Transcript_23804:218-529(-)